MQICTTGTIRVNRCSQPCTSDECDRRRVICFGDSILRNCTDNFASLEIDYDLQVFFYPGATVNNLRTKIREEFFNTYEFDTSYIIIHVGTNNLATGFWEREKKHFIELYRTLGEFFSFSNYNIFIDFTKMGLRRIV